MKFILRQAGWMVTGVRRSSSHDGGHVMATWQRWCADEVEGGAVLAKVW